MKIHRHQTEIIKKLTSHLTLRFNELLNDGLESEHMNYHLKKLIDLGLVEKSGNDYKLTDVGKDYANSLDDDTHIPEKQPKTSVIIYGVRTNEETGIIEFLLTKRLEQPYYGKIGRVGGKVKFGETLEETAARELMEETGLTAEKFTLEHIYRKVRRREDGAVVQDVLFYIMFATGFSGNLVEKTPYQENFWMGRDELFNRKDLDLYDDLDVDERLEPKPLEFEESVGIAEGF